MTITIILLFIIIKPIFRARNYTAIHLMDFRQSDGKNPNKSHFVFIKFVYISVVTVKTKRNRKRGYNKMKRRDMRSDSTRTDI